jgi:hypothetical protein
LESVPGLGWRYRRCAAADNNADAYQGTTTGNNTYRVGSAWGGSGVNGASWINVGGVIDTCNPQSNNTITPTNYDSFDLGWRVAAGYGAARFTGRVQYMALFSVVHDVPTNQRILSDLAAWFKLAV